MAWTDYLPSFIPGATVNGIPVMTVSATRRPDNLSTVNIDPGNFTPPTINYEGTGPYNPSKGIGGLFDQIAGLFTGAIDGVINGTGQIISGQQVGYDPVTGRPVYSGGAYDPTKPETYPPVINPIMRILPGWMFANGRNPYKDAANIANTPPPVSVFNKPLVGDITVGNAIVLGVVGVLAVWGARKLL